jgi:HEAT repeat protein
VLSRWSEDRRRDCNASWLNELPARLTELKWGTEVAPASLEPTTPDLAPQTHRSPEVSLGMSPVVPLELLRGAVFALAGAIVLLSLALQVERAVSSFRTRRAGRKEILLTRLVYRFIQGESCLTEVGALSRLERRVTRGILLRLAPDLRGESGEGIADLYRRLGWLQADLKRLRSWRAMTRANAAADLGLMRAAEALPALTKALDDADVRVRQTAVWALGQAGGPDTLAALVRLLGDSSITVARRAQEILAERGQEVKDAIVTYVGKSANRSGRLAGIELLGWLRIPGGADLLLGFMGDLDYEVRVKSVKAAAAIGDPRFMEVFHRLLEDSRWEVRCQAAKGLTVFGSPDSVPFLEKSLRDPHWWVRFYAATALSEAGSRGEEVLHEAMRDPNPPVRNMARYLLERGGAVPVLP